jgi:ATP-dependent helicase/nuclease subunit A
MVDTTTSPSDTQRLRLIHLPQGNAAPHAPGVVVWAGRKAEDPAPVAAARTAMLGDTEDEYRRLLYVAMTRAADRPDRRRLHARQHEQVRNSSWYDLIAQGSPVPDCSCRRSRHRRPGEALLAPEDVAPAAGTAAPAGHRIELPSGCRRRRTGSAADICCARPILRTTDSHRVRAGESIPLRARALQRGTLVHRLLQSLPDIAAAPPRRRAVVSRPQRDGWTEATRGAGGACWR